MSDVINNDSNRGIDRGLPRRKGAYFIYDNHLGMGSTYSKHLYLDKSPPSEDFEKLTKLPIGDSEIVKKSIANIVNRINNEFHNNNRLIVGVLEGKQLIYVYGVILLTDKDFYKSHRVQYSSEFPDILLPKGWKKEPQYYINLGRAVPASYITFYDKYKIKFRYEYRFSERTEGAFSIVESDSTTVSENITVGLNVNYNALGLSLGYSKNVSKTVSYGITASFSTFYRHYYDLYIDLEVTYIPIDGAQIDFDNLREIVSEKINRDRFDVNINIKKINNLSLTRIKIGQVAILDSDINPSLGV
ncbi:MAG TPA: hypothetical protein PLL53_11645 [Saprospiraceae bacterium]|nr:hypothetical protein [Saprospiraceae bacterium]